MAGPNIEGQRAIEDDVNRIITLHPAIEALLKFFEYRHLPPELQSVPKRFCNLATDLALDLPGDDEVIAGLRKLLEAKDCFARAAL